MPRPPQPRVHAPRQMRVVSESLIHTGHAYDFVDLTVEYRDGAVRTKPIVRHHGSATILPLLDTNQGPMLVMVRNERVAIDDFLLELPAGAIDKGEEPIAAAGRELIEETGYRARDLTPLCSFYTTPGLTDEFMHVFVARNLTHVGQKLEPYEALTVEQVRPDEALSMIDSGRLTDAKTILSLLRARTLGII